MVEDQAEVRKLVSDVLASFGYHVLAVSGPAEALRFLSERSFKLDLLLTDVVMPDMNGREMAERIRRDNPDVRVLFISGYGQEAAGAGGALVPGANFVQKPFAPDALALKVRQTLDAARGQPTSLVSKIIRAGGVYPSTASTRLPADRTQAYFSFLSCSRICVLDGRIL